MELKDFQVKNEQQLECDKEHLIAQVDFCCNYVNAQQFNYVHEVMQMFGLLIGQSAH